MIKHPRKDTRGFTLLEVIVAMGVLTIVLGMIAMFMQSVTSIYYGAVAKVDYASNSRNLSEQIGRDIISSYVAAVYTSTEENDRNDRSDYLAEDTGGTLLVLAHAFLNIDDGTSPAYEQITRLIAYAIDTNHPVVNASNEIVGYPLFRYELTPPENEEWVLSPSDYWNGLYSPSSVINHPGNIKVFEDYIAAVLDTKPEYMLTVSDDAAHAFNPSFDIKRAFVRRRTTIILSLGVVSSNDAITDPDGDGIYEAKSASIVTANTLNLSFTLQGSAN